MSKQTLVTGGTGTLGRQVVPRILAAGHEVRLLSRRPRPPGEQRTEWVTGDLRSGEGIDAAVASVDVIMHCASAPRCDVDAARHLLDAARRAGSPHLVYISIVGADCVPIAYYEAKLAVERLIEDSTLPWTILRATQFHDLLMRIFTAQRRLPVLLVPARTSFQATEASEVADRLVELATAGDPAGRVADLGGPEVRVGVDLAHRYLRATGRHRLVLPVPIPGRVGRGYRCRRAPRPRARRRSPHLRAVPRCQAIDGPEPVTAPVRAWLRAGLALLTLIETATGTWMLLAPRAFYDDAPTVAMYPPLNEHLMRDLGALNLALAIVLAASAISIRTATDLPGLVAYLAYALPHLLFHATHLHDMAADAITLTTSLALLVIAPTVLLTLALTARVRPRAAMTAAARGHAREAGEPDQEPAIRGVNQQHGSVQSSGTRFASCKLGDDVTFLNILELAQDVGNNPRPPSPSAGRSSNSSRAGSPRRRPRNGSPPSGPSTFSHRSDHASPNGEETES